MANKAALPYGENVSDCQIISGFSIKFDARLESVEKEVMLPGYACNKRSLDRTDPTLKNVDELSGKWILVD